MGVVYKGHDRRLDRFVALKFLPPQFGVDAEIKQRFVNEARAASALDHANICTIHEIDETEDGQLFIVMALYEGESVKERIARGPSPATEVIGFGLQIASGLAVAHERGILHRDIKPANIFITRRNEAKILDFGLAKVSGSTKITRTGTSMGTLSYMPPEQLRGEAVDGRADVWALGAVLYEMLTGRAAFGGDSEAAVVYKVLQEDPPPPSSLVPGLTPGFDRLMRDCLAKDIERRTASVTALAQRLESLRAATAAVDDQPTQSWAVEPPPRSLPTTDRVEAVAVLDFTNISGDAGADWLSSGIAETLSVDLKKISSVEVIGRQRLQRALGTVAATELGEDELLRLGRQVGARWLFWGGFQKMEEAIRLTAHCYDTAVAETVGTTKLDGNMSEIFVLQDRILKELLDALDLEVSDSEVRQIERPETGDLEAYEYCARAREMAYDMGPEDLERAAAYLEKAIELDPEYALAYSSLGQLYCFRFIGSTDRQHLEIAMGHLQRAVDLDPDLGDPHCWLTYAFSRERRYEEAIASGRRAVELEADNPHCHYFLAVALWLRGLDEHLVAGYTEAVEHLRQVTRLVPKYQPGYQIQAWLYVTTGQYERAHELLQIAARIEETGDNELGKFVGAISFLGRVAFRLGRPQEAAELFDKAVQVSGTMKHVYAPVCNAFNHCWRGDLLRWQRQRHEALRAFRAAQEQVEVSPRSLGIGWALLQSQIGQAISLQQLGMRREAEASYEKAETLLERQDSHDFSGVWGSGEAEIQIELACYLALAHRTDAALDRLERAVACGWREAPRLDSESLFESLRDEARLRRIRANLASLPPLP